jgi:hypothetical protein
MNSSCELHVGRLLPYPNYTANDPSANTNNSLTTEYKMREQDYKLQMVRAREGVRSRYICL